MRTLFRIVIVLPLTLIMLAFAIANRHWVSVSFDPFPGNDIAAPSLDMPLYAVMAACGALGVLVGGVIVWFRQGRYRRQLRAARAEIEEAKAQAAEARGQANDLRDRVDALGKTAALPAPRKDAA